MKQQKGNIQFVVLLILAVGIAGGVWLVTAGPLNFLPKAYDQVFKQAGTLGSAPQRGIVGDLWADLLLVKEILQKFLPGKLWLVNSTNQAG